MDVRHVHIPNARLEEGRTYPFQILNIVSLGPEDDWFVMQDPNGYKILVPQGFYKSYGFNPGQKIRCRVDKINCNGRMFLEPLHPHYKEGEVYPFDVLCKGRRVNIIGQEEYYFMVKDVYGNQWKIRTCSEKLWANPPEKLHCLLLRIKKGELFLVIHDEEIKNPDQAIGTTHLFTITDERMNPDDGACYYILEDYNGNKHLLKKKYYIHYGLKKGQKIRCRADRFDAEGYLSLEPEHPCYATGKQYAFPVDRLEELVFTDGCRQKVLVLLDCHQEEVKVYVDEDAALKHSLRPSVKARVKRIQKSRLDLEIDGVQSI